MAENSRPLPRSVWLGFSLVTGLIGLGVFITVFQNFIAQKKPLPVIGQVADFMLTNQDGKITTLAGLTNHVWVADIIFTRCAGPCPRMTAQMKSLTGKISDDNLRFVTLTTDPEFDTPAQLKKYGEYFGADFNRWTFLTGDKMQIGLLAANSLKLGAQPVKPEDQKDAADLFIHTTIFVAVDKHAQLRGIYETGGDGVDWDSDVKPRLLKNIRQLENEP